MLRKSLTLIVTFLGTAALAGIAIANDAGGLIKVKTTDFKVFVGELKSEDAAEMTVTDLAGHDHVVAKADVKSVDHDISDDDAVVATNLPTVLTWKIGKMQHGAEKPLVGKVARITEDVVYVSLGKTSDVAVGDHLTVYRKSGDIKDPDTGKLLGSERERLAEIELVEVQPAYSKAKKIGNLEIKLQIGDEVETATHPLAIAVFQPLDAAGNPTDGGTALAEQLTTKLVANKIPVVERARLAAVLTELAIQSTDLFEPETAKKVGHQIGATAVLTGKIVAGPGKIGEVHMRLIEVATGKIVLAASSPLRSGVAGVPAAGGAGAPAGAGVAAAGGAPTQQGKPPIEDRIVAQEETHSHTGGGYNSHAYKLEVPVDKPKVPLLASTISVKFDPGKNTGGLSVTVKISIDYGKTYIELVKYDTAAVMKGRREDNWYHIPLANAGLKLADKRALKAAAADVDQIQVIVEGWPGPTIEVETVTWSH